MKHGFATVVDSLVPLLQRHPKRVSAVVAALLLCGGGGAFAVASMAPDVSDMPVQLLTQTVEPLPLQPQFEALDVHQLNLYRTETTRSSDTARALLERLGIQDPAAAAFLAGNAQARQVLFGRAGRQVTAEADADHNLRRLTVRWAGGGSDNGYSRLVVQRTPEGFAARIENGTLTASSRLASGVIRSSLFAATDEAGLPDSVATQIAEMFDGDVDFRRGLRKGDRFSVVYETLEADDGEPLRTGRVLSAEFVNNGKTYQAMWFQEPGSKGGYYGMDGQSLRRAFLASPMEFSRVTSGFSMRMHPILKTWRAHLGVDYGAPTGTPVRTVGDGVVEFAGVQNGFGNVVYVQHGKDTVTVYAHLSRVLVQKGQKVEQGEHIGLVGSTGWATGPHLHFEFRVHGEHQDPSVLAQRAEMRSVTAEVKVRFDRLAAVMREQLASAASIEQTSAQ